MNPLVTGDTLMPPHVGAVVVLDPRNVTVGGKPIVVEGDQVSCTYSTGWVTHTPGVLSTKRPNARVKINGRSPIRNIDQFDGSGCLQTPVMAVSSITNVTIGG